MVRFAKEKIHVNYAAQNDNLLLITFPDSWYVSKLNYISKYRRYIIKL